MLCIGRNCQPNCIPPVIQNIPGLSIFFLFFLRWGELRCSESFKITPNLSLRRTAPWGWVLPCPPLIFLPLLSLRPDPFLQREEPLPEVCQRPPAGSREEAALGARE